MRDIIVGNILHLMKGFICSIYDNKGITGSVVDLKKQKLLNGRWYKQSKENFEDIGIGNISESDYIFEKGWRRLQSI